MANNASIIKLFKFFVIFVFVIKSNILLHSIFIFSIYDSNISIFSSKKSIFFKIFSELSNNSIKPLFCDFSFISAKSADGRDVTDALIAGLVANIREMTLFLDPSEESYARLGADKAPFAVSWSRENRSQLIRIPADKEGRRAELRSPDPTANPYIAFTLLIHACLDGIRDKLFLPPPADFNMYTASDETLSRYVMLPRSREEAAAAVREGDFISRVLPRALIDAYLNA